MVLFRSRVHDALKGFSGTILNQAALFACIAYVGYQYGSSTLGVFNYLLSLAMFLGTISGLRYDLACVVASPQDSIYGSVHVAIVGAFVCFLVFLLSSIYNTLPYSVSVFAYAFLLHTLIGTYYNSAQSYHNILLPRMLSAAAFLFILLISTTSSRSGNDVFQMYAYSSIIVGIAMSVYILYHNRARFQFNSSFYVRNRRFPLYTLPATLCNSVFNYALPIVFPIWFGAEASGHFAIAYRFGFFPISLCAQSIGGIIRRQSIAAIHSDAGHLSFRRLVYGYFVALVLLSIGYVSAIFLLWTLGRRVIGTGEWVGALDLVVCMMPMFVGQLVFMPMSQTFLVTKAQSTDLLIQLINAIALMLSLAACFYLKLNAFETVLIFSIVGMTIMLLGSIAILRTVRRFRSDQGNVLERPA